MKTKTALAVRKLGRAEVVPVAAERMRLPGAATDAGTLVNFKAPDRGRRQVRGGREVSASRRRDEGGFRPDEFLETLLRIKRDQPRRYEREIGAGQRRCVERYEEQKARAALAVKAKAA